MWVSASEKSLRERIVSAGSDPLEASIAARYRHGLDFEIPALSERVFVSTAAKGLFPSHFAVRQPVLEALLQKPVGSHLWIRTDSQDRTAPDALTLSYRTFDLYLPDNLTGTPDPKRLVSRSRVLRSTLLLIASSGGLDPFTAMFSDTWEHRGAFASSGKTSDSILGLLGKGAGSTPSGDDMLVGAAAVCTLFKNAEGSVSDIAASWLSALSCCEPRFPALTTLMSTEYLKAALQGRFGSHLIALLKCLSLPSNRSLYATVLRVKKHGNTSGLDTLAGVTLACRMIGRALQK